MITVCYLLSFIFQSELNMNICRFRFVCFCLPMPSSFSNDNRFRFHLICLFPLYLSYLIEIIIVLWLNILYFQSLARRNDARSIDLWSDVANLRSNYFLTFFLKVLCDFSFLHISSPIAYVLTYICTIDENKS